jgi:riboflavin kinase/FMN adenylyltransferase
MRILRHYRDIPAEARGAVVALGNFDGVHLGHQALIAEAKRIAAATNKPLAVVVFEPYPREFFRPKDEPFRLTPLPAKARLLAALGADFTIVVPFDAEMAAMAAQDFVLDVLKGALAVSHVVVGRDFQFGKGRGGDTAVLAYMGEMEGFGVTVFTPLPADGDSKISSSDIRTALKAGRPEEAARLLGHWWSVEGVVARGDQRGRELGFPTANLKLDERTLNPAFGVYAVRARIAGEERAYDGAANFGLRPMFELPAPLLEVHLFDFSGDLYGREMTVEFIAYLRGEEKFANPDALKAQMAADCTGARRILATRDGRTPPPHSTRPSHH